MSICAAFSFGSDWLPPRGGWQPYRFGDLLFRFFDSNGAVQGYEFFAEVAEVTVVGGSGNLRSGYACLEKLFFDTGHAVFAEADVDGVGTGVVISPTGEDELLVGGVLHYESDGLEDVDVLAGEAGNADGIVDGGQGTLLNGSGNFNRTVEASTELSLEVGDAGIGSGEACAEGVTVFGFGVNGNDGYGPFGLAEVVGQAEVGGYVDIVAVEVCLVYIRHTFHGSCAEVEGDGKVLGDVELVDKTGAKVDEVILSVDPLVLVVTALGDEYTAAGIEDSVVDATGMVAAPPVGEVDEHVALRSEALHFLLVESVNGCFVGENEVKRGTIGKTFDLIPVDTEAHTDNGREPLTDIDTGVGSETVAELAVAVELRELKVSTTFGSDEPVVLETIEEIALVGVFNVGYFLIVLGNKRLSTEKECKGASQERKFFHNVERIYSY